MSYFELEKNDQTDIYDFVLQKLPILSHEYDCAVQRLKTDTNIDSYEYFSSIEIEDFIQTYLFKCYREVYRGKLPTRNIVNINVIYDAMNGYIDSDMLLFVFKVLYENWYDDLVVPKRNVKKFWDKYSSVYNMLPSNVTNMYKESYLRYHTIDGSNNDLVMNDNIVMLRLTGNFGTVHLPSTVKHVECREGCSGEIFTGIADLTYLCMSSNTTIDKLPLSLETLIIDDDFVVIRDVDFDDYQCLDTIIVGPNWNSKFDCFPPFLTTFEHRFGQNLNSKVEVLPNILPSTLTTLRTHINETVDLDCIPASVKDLRITPLQSPNLDFSRFTALKHLCLYKFDLKNTVTYPMRVKKLMLYECYTTVEKMPLHVIPESVTKLTIVPHGHFKYLPFKINQYLDFIRIYSDSFTVENAELKCNACVYDVCPPIRCV